MKKALAAFALISCAPNPMQLNGKRINEIPMYGGVEKPEKVKKLDEEFVQREMSKGFTRDSTARLVARRGWEYLGQGDVSTAMKRFNQCWLIDSTEAFCHWGFGNTLARMGRPDSALRFLDRAYILDTGNASLEVDIAFTLMGASFRKPKGDPGIASDRARSDEIFQRRSRDPSAAPKVFCLWARVKAFEEDIPGACRLMKSCTPDIDRLSARLGCAGSASQVIEVLEEGEE